MENNINTVSGDVFYLIKSNKKFFIYISLFFLLGGIMAGGEIIHNIDPIQLIGIGTGIIGIAVGLQTALILESGGVRTRVILLGAVMIGVVIGVIMLFVGIVGLLLGHLLYLLGGNPAVGIGVGVVLLVIGIWELIQYLDNDQEKDTDTESNDRLMNMLSPIITNTQNQINRLKRNANIGLIIGIIGTIIAIGMLSYAILSNQTSNDQTPQDWKTFAIHFIPRLTFAVFIELFAYFFLRLYTKNLDDINYFQNELTNLRAKTTAIKMLNAMGKEKDVAELIKELFKIERNFKLAKGESTIDIEKAKTGSDWEKQLITLLEEVLKNIQKK